MPFFSNANVGSITGGQFHEFHGPVNYFFYPPRSQPNHINRPRLTPGTSSRANAPPEASQTQSAHHSGAKLALKITGLFSDIDRLLDLYYGTIFTDIRADLHHMKKVVQFSYDTYEACLRTTFGSFVGKILLQQIQECADALVETHSRIDAIVSSWTPIKRVLICSFPRVAFGVFFNRMEAPDSVLIRRAVDRLGECISALTAFSWVKQFLAQGKATISIRDIEQFMNGSRMFKSVKVEKIVVIDPFGTEMVLPIRFIESFETIHLFLHEACQDTKGGRFIDQRQYQLDDSETNTHVDPDQFCVSLHAGKSFEVTVLVPQTQRGSDLSCCPRCGEDNAGNECRNGFICCTGCRVLFNAVEAVSPHSGYICDEDDTCDEDSRASRAETLIPLVNETHIDESQPVGTHKDATVSPEPRAKRVPQEQSSRASQSVSHNDDEAHLMEEAPEDPFTEQEVQVWTLFRRIRVEVLVNPPSIPLVHPELGSPISTSQSTGFIVVIGATGSGKSSFINAILGDDRAPANHHPVSSTTINYCYTTASGSSIDLVDTPGFSDGAQALSPFDVLVNISETMKRRGDRNQIFVGIIYVQNITNPQLDRISRRDLALFRSICGSETTNVMVVTTFWDQLNPLSSGFQNQTKLEEQAGFFQQLYGTGAMFARSGHFSDGLPEGEGFSTPREIADCLIDAQARSVLEGSQVGHLKDSPIRSPDSSHGVQPLTTFVIVMGATGSGKSSFINSILGEERAPVAYGLESQTSTIDEYRYTTPNGIVIDLVDTPGFNNFWEKEIDLTDLDILTLIEEFTKMKRYQNQQFAGVIYLHHISEPRIDSMQRRNLRLFRKICGSRSMENVMVVTTYWDLLVHVFDGFELEDKLKEPKKGGFIQQLHAGGAKFARSGRFDDGYPEDGDISTPLEILNRLLDHTPLAQ